MGRPRSDISQRIVRAARIRFLHDGVDGASQRQIAREAGTSLGMVYYYFPTKDQLFLAVLEEVYARLMVDLEIALADDAPVEERIRRLYVRISTFDDEEIDVVRLVLREALVSSDRRRQILERFMRGHVVLIIRTVADGVQSGALRAIDPPFLLMAAIAGVGLVPQLVRRLAGPDVEALIQLPARNEFANVAIDVLMNGIGGRTQRAPAPVVARRRAPAATKPKRERTPKKRARRT